MKWIVPFLVALVPLVAAADATKELLTNLPACAAPCYEDAIKKSDCNSTDVKCVCSTQVIIQTAEACAAQACHVRDSLTTLNMTYTYCEVPVRNKTPIFINVTIVLGVISGVATALRLWSKFFYTKTELGLDDLFIVLTLFIGMPSTAMNIHGTAGHGEGRDIWTLEFDDITKFGFYFWLLEVFYFAQVSLLKTSLLFFYLRIFPGNAQKLLWGTIIFNSVFGVLFMFLAAFQCTPVSYFWLKWDGEHKGTCMNSTAIGWANASISVAMDVWMLAVPLWYLRKLKLHWKKKVGVAAMFIVGTFVTVVSIIRLQFLVDLGSSRNPTYDQTDISIWSTVEINVGIICASMPALRVILVRLFPSLGGSSYDSSKYNNYGEHYGRKSHILSRSRARVELPSHTADSIHTPDHGGIELQRTFHVQYSENDEQSLVNGESKFNKTQVTTQMRSETNQQAGILAAFWSFSAHACNGLYLKETLSLLFPPKTSLKANEITRNVRKFKGNMGSSYTEGVAINIQPLSQVSQIEYDSNVFRQYEACRESVNGHLKKYFEYAGLGKSHEDLPGLYVRPLQSQGSEAYQSARLSQADAIKEIIKLDKILTQIKQQKRPYIKAISPLIVAWTAFCFTLPYVTSQGDLAVFFKIGAVSGALLITVQLVRKFLQLRRITPMQHKVRGLVRAFKNGTIRYRDSEEVMISSLD
ncbi:integral membrane protein PTH11 [Fusarium phyllophilum]|uniref:Integral membrane protein PTH11 n=1 Tax=Fusarium phyllophilum TaxID=47803 RepID=A0A8H5JW72_9HYPO|nr:integral membrane protein PTH11 [Fusarium phyllophilum]